VDTVPYPINVDELSSMNWKYALNKEKAPTYKMPYTSHKARVI